MDLKLWSRLGTNYKTTQNTAQTKSNTKYLLYTKYKSEYIYIPYLHTAPNGMCNN